MTSFSNMTARADRRRRRKAIFATVVVHIAILAFFFSGHRASELLPDSVKDLLGMEQTETLPVEEVASYKP